MEYGRIVPPSGGPSGPSDTFPVQLLDLLSVIRSQSDLNATIYETTCEVSGHCVGAYVMNSFPHVIAVAI
jgi:hypothetical protein